MQLDLELGEDLQLEGKVPGIVFHRKTMTREWGEKQPAISVLRYTFIKLRCHLLSQGLRGEAMLAAY